MPNTIENNDYFVGRTSGTMKSDQNIAEVSLKSKEDYWGDKGVRKDFTDEFGDEAENEFNKVYDHVLNDYAGQAQGSFTNSQLTGRYAAGGSAYLYDHLLDERQHYFKMTPQFSTMGGASEQFGRWSDDRWDPREKIMDSGKYINKNGDIVDMPTDVYDKASWADKAVSFENRGLSDVDADGRNVLAWYYDDKQLDPKYRGPAYMVPAYSGDLQKFAGKQAVTAWDY